jgi:hypothetical protein
LELHKEIEVTTTLSKHAARIVIEPWDPAVDKAVRMIDSISPGLLAPDIRIKVHSGGGSGQLGHVESGPGKNPREIHIFKDRIREIVMRNSGQAAKMTVTSGELENAVLDGLMETIVHEMGHLGRGAPRPVTSPFLGEPEAETEARQFMQKVKMRPRTMASLVQAASQLEDIRQKYLPSRPIGEPNLEFVAHVANNNSYQMIKTGVALLLKDELKPAIFDIEDAIKFNSSVSYSKPVMGLFGIITNICKNASLDADFVLELARWQAKNQLFPTGKLDKETLSKVATLAPKLEALPRNFAVVVPGKIYRGGMIDDSNQLKALKSLGIKRIISLHSNPEIARMCGEEGLEHLPAFIESGHTSEYGRNIFGNNVTEILTQKPCYVHCYFGEDRTGGVIARFRTENGWPCKMAYAEAKAHGFKDIFVDLIDWFSEPCEDKPVDTDKIRELLNNKEPYENPELTQEQECSLPTPARNDVPFPDPSNVGYTTYITSTVPTGIMSVPFAPGGGIK